MAAWDFTTVAAAAIFSPSRAPHYKLTGGRRKNVVSGTTLGGLVKSQTRGSDRRTLRLTWVHASLTDAQNFDHLHEHYGGNQAPFKIEVPAGVLPNVSAGATVRVRWEDPELDIVPVSADRYELTITLVEDLT